MKTGNLSIFWQYIALGSGYIGWHYEFLLDSPLLVVGILVGMMIHVIGGGHNSGYDELMNSACWHIGGYDDYMLYKLKD